MYEELLAIFDFSEDPVKLHSFIKTASWPYPVAVKAVDSINIVNTVCSIASFYGVGLEVIRTDNVNPILTDQNYRANQVIKRNLNDNLPENPKNILINGKNSEKEKLVIPSILETKPPQSFSMKYQGNGMKDDDEDKTQGVERAMEIIEN